MLAATCAGARDWRFRAYGIGGATWLRWPEVVCICSGDQEAEMRVYAGGDVPVDAVEHVEGA